MIYFYLADNPQNNFEVGRCISYRKITKTTENWEFEFEHNIDINYGNSGSPICLENNKLLVASIHKEGNKIEPINYGTFIGYILDILEKEENQKFEIKKNETKNIIFINKKRKYQ